MVAVSSTANARRDAHVRPAPARGELGASHARVRVPRPWTASLQRPAAKILVAGGLTFAGWLLGAALSGTASAADRPACPEAPVVSTVDHVAVDHAAKPLWPAGHRKSHHETDAGTCSVRPRIDSADADATETTKDSSPTGESAASEGSSTAEPTATAVDTSATEDAAATTPDSSPAEKPATSAPDTSATEDAATSPETSAAEKPTATAPDSSATEDATSAPETSATEDAATSPEISATEEPATKATATESVSAEEPPAKATSSSGNLLGGLVGSTLGAVTGTTTKDTSEAPLKATSSGGGLLGGLVGSVLDVVGGTLTTVTNTVGAVTDTLSHTVLAPLTQPPAGSPGAPVLLPLDDLLDPVFGGSSNSGGVTATVVPGVTAVATEVPAVVLETVPAAVPVTAAPQTSRVALPHFVVVRSAPSLPSVHEQPRDSGTHATGGGGDAPPGLPGGTTAPSAPAPTAAPGHDGPGGARHAFAVHTDDVTTTQLKLIGTSRDHEVDGAGREAALPTTSPD
ncbi:hypothetical protein DV20_39065 [Amycolatopsis rifamycinica]|uniref:Uncharacterized protein n=1 Tax=Amycolatopsis rifamycinica TaxID=287986 RepID=A0A066TSL6_9PSEU|nr:hypothetical protein DV20_39065 [Amycolatopsis rifamycinica]